MGVAHDRQQRIKEKCDQRRHSTDRADERDEKREEGERRYRLDHADSAENRLRRARQLGGCDAKRDAGSNRRGERCRDEQEMVARQAPEIRAEQGGEERAALFGGWAGGAGEEGRGLREAFAFELGRRVHADHEALVDPSLQCLQRAPFARKSLRYIAPVEEHRVIAREEMPVVLEHAQPIALDLCVGRVHIHHIDAAGGNRLVGQAVIETAGRLPQAVATLQACPAVGAAQKLLRQAEFQLRMLGEIAQPADAKLLGALLAHGEPVGIVEAERHAGRQARGGERAV